MLHRLNLFGFMPHYPGAGAGGHVDLELIVYLKISICTGFDTIEHALRINEFMPKYISKFN